MPESAWSAEGAVSSGCVASPTGGVRRLSGLTLFPRPDGDRTVVGVRGDLDLDTEVDEHVRETLHSAVLGAENGIDVRLDGVRSSGPASVEILLSVDPCHLTSGTERELPSEDEDEAALRVEVAQLRQAMHSRGLIDVARGILVAAFGLGPEDAWETLVSVSQRTNTKLHTVARRLLDSTVGSEPMPDDLKVELGAAVARFAGRDGGSARHDVAVAAVRTE
ncbi:ANTAR domain-containing protein [Streptomyces sp. Q6]|uniref:ANTAR domain-containing protein n=1 Tax=Streptomyces citrinus TaxID=3118173 RepID=A0ACD5ANK6_9ACTN